MKASRIVLGLLLAFVLFVSPGALRAQCSAPTCNKIVNNGLDSAKKVIAVLGDGYATADQAKFNSDVQTLVVDGVLNHDFFQEDNNAFNVYRLNLVSVDSGVSQRVYDEHGTPTDASDDTIVSTTLKNTALGYIWSGSWGPLLAGVERKHWHTHQ
jgi:hypothetical protein